MILSFVIVIKHTAESVHCTVWTEGDECLPQGHSQNTGMQREYQLVSMVWVPLIKGHNHVLWRAVYQILNKGLCKFLNLNLQSRRIIKWLNGWVAVWVSESACERVFVCVCWWVHHSCCWPCPITCNLLTAMSRQLHTRGHVIIGCCLFSQTLVHIFNIGSLC